MMPKIYNEANEEGSQRIRGYYYYCNVPFKMPVNMEMSVIRSKITGAHYYLR